MNKAVVFDLDGTIYYGNSLAFYAKEAIVALQNMGYKILFFTNNSSKSIDDIYHKLLGLGLNMERNEVYSSSYATAIYLQKQKIQKVFLIGSSGFAQELQKREIKIVSEKEAQAIVVGLDIHFNYETIAKALVAVENGAKIIASNVDKNFPIEAGVLRPGSNAIVASILGSCDKELDYIVGKPNSYMLDIIVKDWNLDTKNIWVIGDSVESDIAMAEHYGCRSILVNKNMTTLQDVVKIIQEDKK